MTDRLGRGEGARTQIPGDASDPRGFPREVAAYLAAMSAQHLAPRTVEGREAHLAHLAGWLLERGITRPAEVTRPVLQRYQRWLFWYRTEAAGRPLSVARQHDRLSAARLFFRWLARHNRVLSNPAADLELPRIARRLPKWVLTRDEVERVLSQCDLEDPLGVRDRAILETLYATGIRRFELAQLSLYDLDAERGTLQVRQGKGRKDRVVPIGERAVLWIEKYLAEVRSLFVVEPDCGVLFLGANGESIGLHRLTELVAGLVDDAGIGKRGGCHLFRHTLATLMLEGGADVRVVQEMLGHADISTTQLYTRVSIRHLQRVYLATHPAAVAARSRRVDVLDDVAEEDEPVAVAGDGTEQLLLALAAEAAEEDAGAPPAAAEDRPAPPEPGRFAALRTVRRQRLPSIPTPVSPSGLWRQRQAGRAAVSGAEPPSQ